MHHSQARDRGIALSVTTSLMRGERFVHVDVDGSEHHDTPVEALAREGDALAVPAVPGEEIAYDDALSGRASRGEDESLLRSAP